MIFVTIGTQLSFPRLLSLMNLWAGSHLELVIAQIGNDPGLYPNLRTVTRLNRVDYESTLDGCRAVIAHAGIGTILQCAYRKKPLIIVPHRAKYGEHRNDHQLDTARRFSHFDGITVASNAPGVSRALESISGHVGLSADVGGWQPGVLPAKIAAWVHSQP